jgi:hypothetical protein
VAYEAHALTLKLAGRQAAAGAAAMALAFSAFTWCAASGMEVMPFAWVLARAARRASEWIEADEAARTTRFRRELIALAWAAPLLRPEGAIATLMIALALARFPRTRTRRDRAHALLALAVLGALPLLLLATTGSAASTTAQVKLLAGNPYYRGRALFVAIAANAQMLVGTLLDGQKHAVEFLPTGGAPFAMVGLVAVAALGARRACPWRAGFVIALALTMFAPCTYVTFLWNRLRYLWPFATGWIIGLACLARLLGDLCALVRPRWRTVTTLACGVMTGMLAMRLDSTIDDVAVSASAIDRQQAALGRWAKRALPEAARIGVNDTGAIAYFSDRRTFDVVGLTTRGEGKYWVAGEGSRLEHYERLKASDPARLPTHFIVYPHWLRCDAILGPSLQEATVTDATILGGSTMTAFEASYALLGSGESPWTEMKRDEQVIDALDVADLESEEGHEYAIEDAREGEEVAASQSAPDGRLVVDGGRTMRRVERFVAHLRAGEAARAIVRLEASELTHVRIFAGDHEIGGIDVPPLGWIESAFVVPAEVAQARTVIELRVDGGRTITVFHYWLLKARPELDRRE